MTKPTKYFAIDPRHGVHTRKSPRTYTHCVVARRSYDYARAQAETAGADETTASNFNYYAATIAAGKCKHDRPWTNETAEAFAARCAKSVADARASLKGASDLAEYRAIIRAEAIARVEAAREAGHYETFGSLGWCGRADLANKLAAKERHPRFAEVVILDAVTE